MDHFYKAVLWLLSSLAVTGLSLSFSGDDSTLIDAVAFGLVLLAYVHIALFYWRKP